MGSTGKRRGVSFDNFSDIPYEKFKNDAEYVRQVAERVERISNINEWRDSLTYDEADVLDRYAGNDYEQINKLQYTKAWEDMSSEERKDIATLHEALNKFELTNGIEVNRATNFKIFGSDEPMTMSEVRNFLMKTDGVVQNDAFMSFSTHRDGIALEGRGLVIHLKVPPSKGAGAYIGNSYGIDVESEFLTNTNTIMKFDTSSMYVDGKGQLHINAEALGRAEAQTISPTYKGNLKRK